MPLPVNVQNFPAEVGARPTLADESATRPTRRPRAKKPKKIPQAGSRYAGLSKMFHRAGMPKVAGMFGAFDEMEKRKGKRERAAFDKAAEDIDLSPVGGEKVPAPVGGRPEVREIGGERVGATPVANPAVAPAEPGKPQKTPGEGQIPPTMKANVPDANIAAEGGMADAVADLAPELLVAQLAAKSVAEGFDDLRAGIKLVGDNIVSIAGNDYMGAFNRSVDAAAQGLEKIPIAGQILALGWNLPPPR